MKIRIERIKLLILSFIAILGVWYLASSQIIPQNYYLGMKDLKLDSSFIISMCFFIMFTLIFLKTKINSPHGIFIGIYYFYSVLWFLFFNSISGYQSHLVLLVGGVVFLIPIVLMALCDSLFKLNYKMNLFGGGLLGIRAELVITILIIFVTVLMYLKMGLSFSLDDSYERRILGRDEISGWLAYVFPMTLNGLAPLLAFLAVYNKRYAYIFFAMSFVILGFGFVGTKAPIAYVLLMSFIGYYFIKGGVNIVKLLFYAMFSLIAFSLCEYIIFDHSWVADIYIRRALLAPPQIQMYFLDFMTNYSLTFEVLLIGPDLDKPPTFIIGDLYFNNPLTNANTNSFFTELARNGIIGYIFHIFFLALFFSFLSYFYRISNHKIWLAIAALYSLLLIEQSYSVAFITSGIGLSIIILLFFQHKQT